jgi:pimeloyl-ACP methyl ester carboxylesterase
VEEVGLDALEALKSYRDPRTGIGERFVDLELGGARSVGVLSTPPDDPQATAWLVCHAFGAEQVNLQPIDVALARALAASGFFVLRYHGQGYGDSTRPSESVTLRSHLDDAADAVRALIAQTGLARVGLIGAKLGGSVAAVTAARLGLPMIALLDPVVDGDRYARSLLRLGLAVELAAEGRPRGRATDPEGLIDAGRFQVLGFPVGRTLFDELRAFDLRAEVSAYPGDALVLQVSPTAQPRSDLQAMAGAIRSAGGHASLAVLVDPEARTFGQDRYRTTSDGGKADAQSSVAGRLVDRAAAWCRAAGCMDREAGARRTRAAGGEP